MQTLLDYADKSEPISPATPGAVIYARFEAEPETFAIAVVDESGRPVGLVDRNDFFLRMGAEFGRALYAKRPVSFVMRPPRVEPADRPVMDYLGGVISVNRAGLLDGFIVVDADGRYLAVGTALSLLSAGYAASKARVRELAAKSARLAKAERKAQAGSRAKSQFLAIMSHEIRTPLNGVLAVAEIVERKLEQEELRPYVATIIESGRTLYRLLTDVLDLSRAEAGAMEITLEASDMGQLIRSLEQLWRPLAQQKGLELVVTVGGDRDFEVMADQMRLKQVINNLIGNALKFTGKGRVEARFHLQPQDGAVRLWAEIEDTGPGIAPAQLDRIFEPFAKAEEHNGGAGLGLAICRQLVEAMGGELSAVSRLGKGSTFRFAVTLARATVAAPAVATTTSASARVLVVDDNEANRLVACTMLEMAGVASVVALDGFEAIERAQAEAFDAILMDVKMPRMGGVEATRAIRALSGPNQEAPILAVTANADPADAASYLAAGMNGVVPKPVNAQALLTALAEAMQADRRAAAQAA